MRTLQIFLLLLSLLSISLALSTPPGGSGSASHYTNTGKTSSTRGTVENSHQGPHPPGPGKSKDEAGGTTQTEGDLSDPSYGSSRREPRKPSYGGESKSDDGDDKPKDGTSTNTGEGASDSMAAQEERSTPAPLSMPTLTSSSSGETTTTSSNGAGMDSADMSLLGLLVAVGMGVLVY